MISKTGNMFADTSKNTRLIATTCNVIMITGKLVMGRGAALQMSKLEPGIQKDFGDRIKQHMDDDGLYGTIMAKKFPSYGMFQTKKHFKDDSQIETIRASAYDLMDMAQANPTLEYRLNYPGIGCGRMDEEEVAEVIVDLLPDNVTVWKFK